MYHLLSVVPYVLQWQKLMTFLDTINSLVTSNNVLKLQYLQAKMALIYIRRSFSETPEFCVRSGSFSDLRITLTASFC